MNLKNVEEELEKGNYQILNKLIELNNQQQIDNIISSINLFKYCKYEEDFNEVKKIFDFIDNYYKLFKSVDIFKDSKVLIKITQNKVMNNDLWVDFIKNNCINSEWFFELLKPSNFYNFDIAKFQSNIEKINLYFGVSLQEKANNYYKELRKNMSNYVNKIIIDMNNDIENLNDEEQEDFIYFIKQIILDNEYESLFNVELQGLSQDEINKYQDFKKNYVNIILTIKLYVDLLLAELFEATPTVVYKDMLELFAFHQRISENEKFLSEEPVFNSLSIMNLYENIITMGWWISSSEEAEEFGNQLKEFNIKERFYDDMLLARRKSEKLLKAKLYNFSSNDYCKDPKLINKWPNITIYDLRGNDKKYSLIIRTLGIPFNQNYTNSHIFDCYTYINESNNYAQFTNGKNSSYNYIYGYYSFPDDYLIYTSKDDSFTLNHDKYLEPVRKSILTDGSVTLTEINILNNKIDNNYVQFKPDFIVAYNDISQEIYNDSLRLNIPVVLLTSHNEKVDYNFYPYGYPKSSYYGESSSITSEYFKDNVQKNM